MEFEGSSRFRRNNAVGFVLAYGMLGFFIVPLLAALSPVPLTEVFHLSRDWIGCLLFLGGFGLGVLCGVPQLKRMNRTELVVDSDHIEVHEGEKEVFFSKWNELGWRRGGTIFRKWVPVDPMGRSLPENFTGAADFARFRLVLQSRMPQTHPPIPTKPLLGIAALCVAIAGPILRYLSTNFSEAELPASLEILRNLCGIVFEVGLTLLLSPIYTIPRNRDLKKLPESRRKLVDSRHLRQAIYLAPGVRYRYEVPDDRLPRSASTRKRLGDVVTIQPDGSLRVERGEETFVCEEPLQVSNESATSHVFSSSEVWKRGNGRYLLDRRYLVPVESILVKVNMNE